MKRVFLLVEGQTEETFTREVLAPHLEKHEIYPEPILAKTKRVKDGPDFKGGITSYERVKNDINLLLPNTNVAAVTTMIDFYGLPSKFPGRANMPPGDCYKRVAHVEDEFGKAIGHRKFIPHLMLHEFEALMFVRPDVIAAAFPEVRSEAKLRAIKGAFNSPEEINDDPNKAPSKRLKQIFGGAYQKDLHGPLVTIEIGIEQIRRECAHFNAWLEKLETL